MFIPTKNLINFIHSLNNNPNEIHIFDSVCSAERLPKSQKEGAIGKTVIAESSDCDSTCLQGSFLEDNPNMCHLVENVKEIVAFLELEIPFLNANQFLKIVKKIINFIEMDWNDFDSATCQCHLRPALSSMLSREKYRECHGFIQEKEALLSICYDLLESGCRNSSLDSRSDELEKIYFLPGQYSFLQIIKLREDAAIISKGTTGLSTWGASLYLLEYLSSHKSEFQDKSIVELGSGCGLLGFSLAQLGAKHVLLTDVAQSVLKRLHGNRQRLEMKNVGIQHWDWTDIANCDQFSSTGAVFDLILAADVVFDPELIPFLVTTISKLYCYTLVACTERNQATFQIFLKELTNQRLSFTKSTFIPTLEGHSWFCYHEKSPIHLIKINPQKM